jgi:hypothetical protein
MPFSANEVLIAASEIPGGSPEKIKTLAGEVASKLGAKFKAEYKDTDKQPIAFSKAEKLKDSKKLKGKTALKWQVKVDPKGKDILFVVTEGTKVLDEATIFEGLHKLVTGAEVINLQGADKTMVAASSKQAGRFNDDTKDKATYNDPRPGKAQVNEKSTDLAEINKKMRIVLTGHGGGDAPQGDKVFTANKFGGRNAKEIVDFLIGEGLDASYKGTIYLSGCHSAAGFNDDETFAKKVHELFSREGYKKLSVAGTAGVSWTHADGSKSSRTDALTNDIEKTHAQTAKLLDNLRKAQKGAEPELLEAEAEDKALADQYKTVAELIEEMPEIARDSLHAKLLTPIEKQRADLAPALEQMRRANKTLEGAIKSEEAYLGKLDGLLADKKSLTDGSINLAEYKKRANAAYTVDDWWGVFGPAKATKAKVSQERGKLGSLISAFKAKMKK